ncbi:hypothetical protein B0J17DRAFT_773974 [Rhizoctonia solani]|nr:hypothetical protein B0J17DRAFT_773974 [Rhizoctonia solani]
MGKNKEKGRQDARPYLRTRPWSRPPSPLPSPVSLSVPVYRSSSTLSPTIVLGDSTLGVASQSEIATAGSTDPRLGHASHSAPGGAKKGRKRRNIFDKLGSVLTKSASPTGVLKPLVDGIEEVTEIFQSVGLFNSEHQSVLQQLTDLLEKFSECITRQETIDITGCIQQICGEIYVEIDRVKARHKEHSHPRQKDALQDVDDMLTYFRRVNVMIACLNLNVDVKAFRVVNEYVTESRLNGLKQTATTSGIYNSAESDELGRRSCTNQTRTEPAPAYWLNGMAGTGKTTISYTLCEKLKEANMLGASFFCSRSLPQCRDVNLILPLVAYQLACFSSPFRCLLVRELEMDPDIHTKALKIQFENMIVKPLMEAQNALFGRKVVVVIDALDECESSQGVRQLLDLLIKEELKFSIKIFLSSRPESEIYPRMSAFNGAKPRPYLILHELGTTEICRDIKTYFRAELQSFDLPDSHITRLVAQSGVLFIYASTVVKYIQEGAEQGELGERLATMLGLTSVSHSLQERDIDTLYETILARAFDNPRLETGSKQRMERVLWTVICAQEPLTINGIAGLLEPMTSKRIQAVIQPLRSVLHVTDSNGLVTTLHASFLEFMLNPYRSARFHRPASEYHSVMCRACFHAIKNHIPQFNICALESSFYPEKEVIDIDKRTNNSISAGMYYACRHWAAHLERSGQAADLETLLEDFLSARLLLWMEVLNLTRRMNEGPRLLQAAKRWCINLGSSREIIDLAQDAWSFVLTYTGNTGNNVTLLDSQTGEVILGPLNIHTRHINPIGFSPNGVHFATVSDNGAIRIWDRSVSASICPTPTSNQSQIISSASTSEITRDTAWDMSKNGWMVNDRSQYLAWVPLSLRPLVLAYCNTGMVSAEGYIKVDFGNAFIGEKWTGCYIPAS